LFGLERTGNSNPLRLKKSLLSIGFNMTGDLSGAKDPDAILGVVKTLFPDAKPVRQAR
jgi:predicted Mrr-cat superfamily restriction endonuclease